MVVPGHARRALASHQPCPYAIVADTPLQNRSASDGSAPHFGWRFGSPPGVPGGGITGVRPPPTGGTAIPGSTPAGGHITPLDSESCSLSGRFPVVSFERGATLPRPGEQFRFDGDDEGGGSERFDCACAVVVASSAAAARATAMVELRIGNLRGVSVCNVNVRRRRSFRREPSPPVRAPRTCARARSAGSGTPGRRRAFCDRRPSHRPLPVLPDLRKARFLAEATMAKTATRKWSADVTKHSNALDLAPGVFALKNPKRIAASLRHSAETSRRRKVQRFSF